MPSPYALGRGRALCFSITTARASAIVSLVTCQLEIRINDQGDMLDELQEAIFFNPILIPPASKTLSKPISSAHGEPLWICVKLSVSPISSLTSRKISVIETSGSCLYSSFSRSQFHYWVNGFAVSFGLPA